MQVFQTSGHFFDNIAQGFVAANHIGWHFLGPGALLPPLAQCLPQTLFALGTQPIVFRLLGGRFFAAQGAQHDFGFALEDFFCRFGQLQGLMLLDIDGEIAQADALADDAAPFFVGLFAADAECG